MTIENSSSEVPIREHDVLPTVAIPINFLNRVRAFLQTPVGKTFPMPTQGILESEQTAIIKSKDGVFKVRVHEVRGELKPGQQVILFKQGIQDKK